MMDELGVFPHNASNCSVIMVDGILYVCTSNGQDWTHVNIPSPTSPSFIGLDSKTGTGGDAVALAREGRWDELGAYCRQDTVKTRAVSCLETIRLPLKSGRSVVLAGGRRFEAPA